MVTTEPQCRLPDAAHRRMYNIVTTRTNHYPSVNKRRSLTSKTLTCCCSILNLYLIFIVTCTTPSIANLIPSSVSAKVYQQPGNSSNENSKTISKRSSSERLQGVLQDENTASYRNTPWKGSAPPLPPGLSHDPLSEVRTNYPWVTTPSPIPDMALSPVESLAMQLLAQHLMSRTKRGSASRETQQPQDTDVQRKTRAPNVDLEYTIYDEDPRASEEGGNAEGEGGSRGEPCALPPQPGSPRTLEKDAVVVREGQGEKDAAVGRDGQGEKDAVVVREGQGSEVLSDTLVQVLNQELNKKNSKEIIGMNSLKKTLRGKLSPGKYFPALVVMVPYSSPATIATAHENSFTKPVQRTTSTQQTPRLQTSLESQHQSSREIQTNIQNIKNSWKNGDNTDKGCQQSSEKVVPCPLSLFKKYQPGVLVRKSVTVEKGPRESLIGKTEVERDSISILAGSIGNCAHCTDLLKALEEKQQAEMVLLVKKFQRCTERLLADQNKEKRHLLEALARDSSHEDRFSALQVLSGLPTKPDKSHRQITQSHQATKAFGLGANVEANPVQQMLKSLLGGVNKAAVLPDVTDKPVMDKVSTMVVSDEAQSTSSTEAGSNMIFTSPSHQEDQGRNRGKAEITGVEKPDFWKQSEVSQQADTQGQVSTLEPPSQQDHRSADEVEASTAKQAATTQVLYQADTTSSKQDMVSTVGSKFNGPQVPPNKSQDKKGKKRRNKWSKGRGNKDKKRSRREAEESSVQSLSTPASTPHQTENSYTSAYSQLGRMTSNPPTFKGSLRASDSAGDGIDGSGSKVIKTV